MSSQNTRKLLKQAKEIHCREDICQVTINDSTHIISYKDFQKCLEPIYDNRKRKNNIPFDEMTSHQRNKYDKRI